MNFYRIKARRHIYGKDETTVDHTRDWEEDTRVLAARDEAEALEIVRREFPDYFNGRKYRIFGCPSYPYIHEEFVGFGPAPEHDVKTLMKSHYVQACKMIFMMGVDPFDEKAGSFVVHRTMEVFPESYVAAMNKAAEKVYANPRNRMAMLNNGFWTVPPADSYVKPGIYSVSVPKSVKDVWKECL